MHGARLLSCLVCMGTPAVICAQLSPRDSLRILDQAHAAQASFERTRRGNLPMAPQSDAHECQVIVGRMCYWNDDGDPETPQPESRAIVNARRKLIATLGQLNALSRGDPWIAGERVRYLIEAGADSAAVVASRECWAARWWCNALLGFAEHESEHYAEAQAAFDSALAAMPADVRCRWTDISLLLDDDMRDRYEHTPCALRAPIEQRFWEMAHPSYVVAANDRRTEHFSRVLLAELSSDAANAYGMPWGDDLRELLIRYGQPIWYGRPWPTMMGLGQGTPTPTGHDRHPSYHFAAALDGDSVRWDIHTRIARERYSPPYLDSLVDLDAQFAMLKRGDSALVVAVFANATRGDSAVLGVSVPHGATIVASDSAQQIHVRRALAGWKGLVVGIEKFDPATRTDARARAWLAPPTRAANAPELSTLLLFTGDTSVNVISLDDALAHALTANELNGTRRLGIYWEMYGERGGRGTGVRDTTGRDASVRDTAARDTTTRAMMVRDTTARDTAAGDTIRRDAIQGDSGRVDTTAHRMARSDSAARDSGSRVPPDISISVTRTDGGIFRWLTQTLRITHRDSPLVVRWHDARVEDGIAARSVVLDLAQLPAGTYRITLAAGPDDAHQTRASREIRVR